MKYKYDLGLARYTIEQILHDEETAKEIKMKLENHLKLLGAEPNPEAVDTAFNSIKEELKHLPEIERETNELVERLYKFCDIVEDIFDEYMMRNDYRA